MDVLYAWKLRRAVGDVQDCLMAMPADQPLAASREELKRCLSDLISISHTVAQLENKTQ